ncbi:MAG: LapA family protein, partial [Mariprofundaceae bacterium]
MLNWINVLVVIVLTSFATMFAMGNQGQVEIHFLGLSSIPMPLYIPVFVAFLLGFSGGVLALSFSRRKHKQEIIWLRNEHEHLQK